MSDYITAAEATTILRDLARGREDGDGGDVWPLYDRAEDAMRQVIALDLAATRLESERAAERTRADAARAECARLRAEAAVLIAERDDARLMSRCSHGNWQASLAEVDALRAAVEGRTVPTPADVAAHALARPLPTPGAASNGATCNERVGLWLCVVDGEGSVVLRLARESDDQGPYLMAWSSDYGWCGTGDIRRAWPLDASGRPCPWPTPALDAAAVDKARHATDAILSAAPPRSTVDARVVREVIAARAALIAVSSERRDVWTRVDHGQRENAASARLVAAEAALDAALAGCA